MAETSQAPPPELSETFKRRLHYVNEWMAQGLLTTEKFFENWNEATSSINGTYDHGDDFLRRFESIAIEDETGTKYLDETSFLSFLRQHNVFPRAFQEVEPILLRSACYFIDYPFSTQHPATFTIKELERACWWLEPRYQHLGVEPCGGGSRDFTKTDKRRLLFQSLSTERNGARLPFDPDEWRREARRRTLDISAWKMSHRNQSDHFCCDEWGDELYHDLLDVVMALQPERPLPVMGEPRDCFRPFVARMHNGAPKLREFTISPDRLRVVVRFCLYHVFGLARKDHPVHAVDLEGATDCVMRAFPQDPDIGINWPMFDEGCRAAPHLFRGLQDVILLFWLDPSPIDEDSLEIMRTPSRLFTSPVILQISTVLSPYAMEWFTTLLWTWYRDTAPSPLAVSELVASIQDQEDYALILISGRDIKNQDLCTFGLFMPLPAKDNHRIQPKIEDELYPPCFFLELSPAQGIYPGTLESPAWTMNGEDMSIGDPNNGVALVLKDGLSRATFTQVIDGDEEPIYEPIRWRGNRHTDFDIEAIEIVYSDWVEPSDDEDGSENASSDAASSNGSDRDQPEFSPTNSQHE